MASHSPISLTAKIIRNLPPHDPGLPAPSSTDSFWHQDPTPFLHNHRTTPHLPSTAKTVIIGSGLAGTLSFKSLSTSLTPEQLGNVVMLEARSSCWGATGRNGGHCKPALYQYGLFLDYIAEWGEDAAIKLARFERLNLELMRELAAKHREADFTDTDGADVYYELESWEIVKRCVEKLAELDPELGAQCEIVDGVTEEGKKKLAELRVPTAVGAVTGRTARLWPFRLVEGILGEVVGQGVLNLQCNTPVSGLGKAEDGGWIVETERGEIKAERVVVTANAHTGHLIPVLRDWIYPVRGQMSALTPPKSVQEKPFTHSYALIRDIYNRSDYFHQRPPPGSQLMMGGGRQLEKNQGVLMQDGNISRDVAKYLRGALSGYFADETGYPDDEDEPAVQATPRESEPKLRESFLDRFSKLQISAGHDAWDAAEGAGMFMSSSFHQPSPRVPQIPTLVSSPTKECHAEFEWSGTMGFSRDDHPYVGRVPEIGKEAAEKLGIPEMNDTRGLWVCAGFCGHGMALVSGSTKALGGMVARDEAEGADGDDEAWKRVEDWFPEAFIVTSERLGIEAEKDGIEGQYQGWVIVNGYKEEADDM